MSPTSRWTCRALGVVSLGATLAGAAAPQTLADVARREEERRKAIGAPSRLYTNETLRIDAPATPPATPPAAPAPGLSPTPATAQPPAQSSGRGAATPTETPRAPSTTTEKDAVPRKDEAYWRQRLQQARDARQRAEVLAEALQSRINALTTDFVNRDDPAQQRVITTDREKAIQELDRVKKELQQHTKDIADVQEDARKAGVPAGWIR